MLLGAAIIAILAAGLFPYHFERSPARSLSFDLVGSRESALDVLRDVLLNLLLFLPFGMGLTARARQHGATAIAHGILVMATGSLLSLAVEGLQTLLPPRDPSLRDVVVNTLGALLGRHLLVRWQGRVSAICRAIGESWRRLWLIRSPGRALCAYFALALLSAALLQTRTRLSDWSTGYPLIIGNEASGDRPWSGWIRLLEISDRALGARQVGAAVSTGLDQLLPGSLVASYRFTEGPPTSTAPAAGFSWKGPDAPSPGGVRGPGPLFSGTRWLESNHAGRQISEALRRTNQLTVKLVCRTESLHQRGPGRIVSISGDPYHRNLTIGQEGSALVARLRTPLTGPNGREPELVRHDVFARNVDRTILLTYDGSTLAVFIDGSRDPTRLELSPGAVLAGLVSSPAALDLPGYAVLFLALVLVPAGVLLALAVRGRAPGVGLLLLVGALGLLLAGGLELILILTSGRSPDFTHVVTGTALCSGAAVSALHFRCS